MNKIAYRKIHYRRILHNGKRGLYIDPILLDTSFIIHALNNLSYGLQLAELLKTSCDIFI